MQWSSLQLAALAASQGGAYLCFGLQYALLTPYVLELGLPSRWASLIWLGGPVTGIVVQPLIGRLSDRCTGPWARLGRRRPFLLASAACVAAAQLLVGNAKDLGALLGDPGADRADRADREAEVRPRAIAVFVAGFWLLDAGTNAVWVVSKALTSDIVPPQQLPRAFSIATGVTGAGLALGYVAGSVQWSRMQSLSFLVTDICGHPGGCDDLRASFLLAIIFCILLNTCTVLVGSETNPSRIQLRMPLVTDSPVLNGNAGSSGTSETVSSISSGSVAPEVVNRTNHSGESALRGGIIRLVLGNVALRNTYLTTLLVWLGWISLQMYETHFVAAEVFDGSSDPTSPTNPLYVEGIRTSSKALIANALLMSLAMSCLPAARTLFGDRVLWASSIVATSTLLASSLLIRSLKSRWAACVWLALLGPCYGIQQTIPFVLVASHAPGDLLGELNGYLNVALCLPQLAVSLLGGMLTTEAGSDTALFLIGAVVDLIAVVVACRLPGLPDLPHLPNLPDMPNLSQGCETGDVEAATCSSPKRPS